MANCQKCNQELVKCDSCGNIGCNGLGCANSAKDDFYRCKLCGSSDFSRAGG